MRLIRPLYVSAVLALALASCGTTKKVTAPAITNIDMAVAKKAPIADAQLKRWSHLDLLKDSIPGMSVDRAYAEILKDRKSEKVIVGIVDSGVDIEHEDLVDVIWTNTKEIPGNGIDDDNNGYIDDVHGWNFLGDAIHENMELVRILKKGDTKNPDYARAKAEYDKEYAEAMAGKQQIDFILNADKAIKTELKKSNYTIEDLKTLNTTNSLVNQVKPRFIQILSEISKDEFDKEIQGAKDHYYSQLNYSLNMEFNGRKIVGDNVDDLNDNKYGNNNVMGPDKKEAKHGTHVAGIVAASRNNGKGGDGIANNVAIMAVRAVPDGDEYDKDIALGIRYAVDNGAKVINGSFGKYYSTHPQWVLDALKYAADKDVLVVIAAGNDSYDLDVTNKYPNDSYNNDPEFSNNVIIIGALNTPYNINLLADFSNYGKKNVDVFSPGMKIYSTTPNNTYEYLQGTSMASPNVAGVAALIRSYYPKLSAVQVKQILMESGLQPKLDVIVGGDKDDVKPFSEVSKSGRMVNAYNALIMADKLSK